MSIETTSNADLASQILGLLGQDTATAEVFRRCTRDQLLEIARRMGLTGVSKLSKEVLAGRVLAAYENLIRAGAPPRAKAPAGGVEARRDADAPADSAADAPADAAADAPADTDVGKGAAFHKFDLGPGAEEKPAADNIPWGYGEDRITAMYVNPERLYTYWEVTDGAIDVARRALGPGGKGAWLNLRVYDISGRLFDGTNAHSYFDHKIERHDRQWFFDVGKPTSTACVEVGLKSPEGYFVKIGRSGRVDFPRRGPAGEGPVEWLTVRTASGYAGEPHAAGAAGTGAGAVGGGGELGGEGRESWQGWTEGAGFPVPGGGHRVFERRWEWQEGAHEQWQSELSRVEWVGPVLRTEWEEGPFSYPVEPPSVVEHRESGEVSVKTHNGRVHVVYGPWQVVIRGIGARAERRVLATWEYKRTVAVTGGIEREVVAWGRLAPGSSEWLALGASERAWLGASELLFRGSSELYMLGASELRFRGASETLYMGASEYRYRGASERMWRGASERLWRGASERMYAGASERLYAGASERMGGGASERLYAGASERRLGGASEGGVAGAAPPSPYPPPPYPYPET